MMPLSLRDLAEIAALVSARASLVIDSAAELREDQLQSYWRCSRGRSLDWLKTLDAFACQLDGQPVGDHAAIWRQVEPLLNEVFVAEILTRVWAAVLTASDRRRRTRVGEPIARHTVNAHNDARHRAMTFMISRPQVPLTELARVDRMRRKAERWTDLLLGHLVQQYGLEELTFDTTRSLDFAQSQLCEIVQATDEPVWEFVLAGVRLGFRGVGNDETPSDVWNRGIIRAVVASFPPQTFDEFGCAKSLYRARLETGASLDRALTTSRPASESDRSPTSRINFAELRQRFRKD